MELKLLIGMELTNGTQVCNELIMPWHFILEVIFSGNIAPNVKSDTLIYIRMPSIQQEKRYNLPMKLNFNT